MEPLLPAYSSSIGALGYVGALLLIQLLVADVTGIRSGHSPGSPVPADHGNVLFRVTRTVANMNESIAIFLCGLIFCWLSAASPSHTAVAAWAYAASRTLYAACYYADLRVPRSVCFGLSLLALAALPIIGFLAL